MNDKDHLVGQLTKVFLEYIWPAGDSNSDMACSLTQHFLQSEKCKVSVLEYMLALMAALACQIIQAFAIGSMQLIASTS